MYVIFGTIIVLIIVMFGSSIVTMVKANTSSSSPNNKLGNIWFISLLLINLCVIIFIYTFYYYKITDSGKLGPTGNKGYKGDDCENCMIPDCNYYAPYTKIK